MFLIQLHALVLLLLKSMNLSNPISLETKSGSQVFKADSPSKKLVSCINSGTLNQFKDLQPVEEEDKNESSNKDFSHEFDRSYYDFGPEYRQSFK